MKTTQALAVCATVVVSVLLWAAWTHGAQRTGGMPPIDTDDLAGVVTGPNGPRPAYEWSRSADLPTKFARIVVTDDLDGRIDAGRRLEGARSLGRHQHPRPFHMEGGKGTTSKAVRFQLRPDPLAR